MHAQSFISLDSAAAICDTTRRELQRLAWVDKKQGRSDRFMVERGELKVHPNYKCPHFDEICDLYFKAVECATSEMEIARFIAKRTGKNEHCIYFYFRNFKFKNPDFARVVVRLLKIFIKQNNLFAEIDEASSAK